MNNPDLRPSEAVQATTVLSETLHSPDARKARDFKEGHLDEGEKIGRYVVLRTLGAGGMGVVYAAYDPELDRKVALKLLRPSGDSAKKEVAKARLLREAQSMAQLDHPNVIPVHDVGTLDDRVFLAMEFIEGKTLGEWLAEDQRPWKEILDAFEMAGRGLAAAHQKGLVHRDFKPDNVMVGDDGRIRVMDFGLARPSQDEIDTPRELKGNDEMILRSSASSMLSKNLTRVGAIMGTPAYMSPEQMNADETDARTDQFSFCVALWEALYKERPFRGETLGAMAYNLSEGNLVLPQNYSKVPRWLRKVIRKGLQTEPGKRFDSMPELLEAFAKGQSRTRMKRVFVGAAGSAALAGISFGAYHLDEQRKREACGRLADSMDKDWNDQTREQIRSGLLSTGQSYAETTADKVIPWLDQWADSWKLTRRDTCLASDVQGSWEPDLRARSDECLDERRMYFESLIEEISQADEKVAQKAVGAAANLPDSKLCGEEHYLKLRPELPEGGMEHVREIRGLISRASSLIDAGKYQEGHDVAKEALEKAEVFGHTPLIAESRASLGLALRLKGDYDGAEEQFSEAYLEAGTSGAPEVAVYAATKLVYVTGYKKAQYSEGLVWGKAATVALKNMELDEGLRQASLLSNLAVIHQTSGDHEQSKELHEKALKIREAELGPDHPSVAVSLNNLAVLSQLMNDDEEALILHKRALAIREKTLGPDHPDVGYSLSNLAAIYEKMGEHEKAKAMYERVAEIWEKSFDANHPNLGANLTNLALVLQQMGQLEKAKELHKEAMKIFEESLGPDHPMNAHSLHGLAAIALEEGDLAGVLPLAERAAALRERDRSYTEEYAEGIFIWARALWDAPENQGRDRKKAIELAKQAQEIYEKSQGREEKLAEVSAWLSER